MFSLHRGFSYRAYASCGESGVLHGRVYVIHQHVVLVETDAILLNRRVRISVPRSCRCGECSLLDLLLKVILTMKSDGRWEAALDSLGEADGLNQCAACV